MINGIPPAPVQRDPDSYILREEVDDLLISRLSTMTRQSKLFKAVRAEMEKRGHWKFKARGNPKAGYKKMVQAISLAAVNTKGEVAQQVDEFSGGFSDGL